MTGVPPLHRGLLFVPGHRADRFDKALAAGASAVIIDLEDAVAPERRPFARGEIAQWLAAGVRTVPVWVRINPVETRDALTDLAAVIEGRPDGIVLPKARDGADVHRVDIVDSMISDGLWDPYNNVHMGNCGEKCAAKFAFTREQQDAFAMASVQRANAAQNSGALATEITPVEIADAKGNVTTVAQDEGPAKVKYDKIPTLRPAFDKAGTITAANASTINDGAAALVLTTGAHAAAQGWKPLARLVAFGAHAQDPVWFTTAPVQAARNALASAGWRISDVDLWEVNEAFAVVPMAFAQELGVSRDRLNVRGGAISLGHPIGASGARIVVTLIAALQERGLKRGVAAICIGGGEGLAACVELI